GFHFQDDLRYSGRHGGYVHFRRRGFRGVGSGGTESSADSGGSSAAGDGGRGKEPEEERSEAEAERERCETLRGEGDGVPPGGADPGTGAGDSSEGHRPEMDGSYRRYGSAPPGHRPAGLRPAGSQGRVQDGCLRYV